MVCVKCVAAVAASELFLFSSAQGQLPWHAAFGQPDAAPPPSPRVVNVITDKSTPPAMSLTGTACCVADYKPATTTQPSNLQALSHA